MQKRIITVHFELPKPIGSLKIRIVLNFKDYTELHEPQKSRRHGLGLLDYDGPSAWFYFLSTFDKNL